MTFNPKPSAFEGSSHNRILGSIPEGQEERIMRNISSPSSKLSQAQNLQRRGSANEGSGLRRSHAGIEEGSRFNHVVHLASPKSQSSSKEKLIS